MYYSYTEVKLTDTELVDQGPIHAEHALLLVRAAVGGFRRCCVDLTPCLGVVGPCFSNHVLNETNLFRSATHLQIDNMYNFINSMNDNLLVCHRQLMVA